jgi:hypothetical protein
MCKGIVIVIIEMVLKDLLGHLYWERCIEVVKHFLYFVNDKNFY